MKRRGLMPSCLLLVAGVLASLLALPHTASAQESQVEIRPPETGQDSDLILQSNFVGLVPEGTSVEDIIGATSQGATRSVTTWLTTRDPETGETVVERIWGSNQGAVPAETLTRLQSLSLGSGGYASCYVDADSPYLYSTYTLMGDGEALCVGMYVALRLTVSIRKDVSGWFDQVVSTSRSPWVPFYLMPAEHSTSAQCQVRSKYHSFRTRASVEVDMGDTIVNADEAESPWVTKECTV